MQPKGGKHTDNGELPEGGGKSNHGVRQENGFCFFKSIDTFFHDKCFIQQWQLVCGLKWVINNLFFFLMSYFE